MVIKDIIPEDFVNYKKPSMTILFPHCSFKCGAGYCQNSPLAKEKNVYVDVDDIVNQYINNPITKSIVMQGLEPIDSWADLTYLIAQLRDKCDDDIVIYTGYNKEEITEEINILSGYKNIIVKFGRYIPNQKPHYDETLGVYLSSDNQYAIKIS